jgi:ectoine hydroxylase-related dioxygenase (phytanoyl-CoA dioxygenase family)
VQSPISKIQIKNEISDFTDGTLHHLLLTGDEIFLDLLKKLVSNDMNDLITSFFGGKFILNTYGAVKNLKYKPSYVSNIHRDIRFFTGGVPLMLQALILLDDFTIENGATYFLAGSHMQANKPDEAYFFKNSLRALGKKGDVYFFDSNLWHAAGVNTTDYERRAITIGFTKPFMKQQLDYSRALGYNVVEKLTPELIQVLGYNSRVPSNLDEWYQKPENRFYKPNQN